MTYQEFQKQLLALSPSSKCLQFIADRVEQDNYRGKHISQHNRYEIEDVCNILYELKRFAGKEKLKIRTIDLSKHPNDMVGTEKYSAFCSELQKKYNKFTQDTIRKNFFVDFARMGFINKYNKKGELIPLSKQCCCQYVSLTERGKILANKNATRKDKYIAFSKGLDMLSSNLPMTLYSLCSYTNGKITRMEYTYFVSFLGEYIVKRRNNRTKRNIVSENQIIDFIKEYRSLSNIHSEIDKVVKAYCTPKNFSGNKREKRDFYNWLNETDQTFKLLSTTVYFEYLAKYTTLKLRVDAKMGIDNMDGLARSAQEKENYFAMHHITRKNNMRLHHIVPLEFWQDLDDYKLLDDWRNMIYIEETMHSDVHKLHPVPCILDINDGSFSIKNNNFGGFSFTNGQEVEYSADNANILLNYNKDLLKDRII